MLEGRQYADAVLCFVKSNMQGKNAFALFFRKK